MSNDEAVFVEVWKQKWSKIPNPQKLQANGIVRRIYVGSLLGKTLPRSLAAGGQLIDGIFSDLKSTLKADALYWSPAPGLIDVFYANMGPQAADLSHSVLTSAISRRIQDTIVNPARSATLSSPAPDQRRVDNEEFQRVCRKGQARPDQIQTIDIGEIVLGKPDPQAHLSRRTWQMVDTVLDEFLARGGYSTRYSGNQILLFFPGLSASLASLKRKAIASEIEVLARELAGRVEVEEDGEDARPNTETKKPQSPGKSAIPVSREEAKEIASLNRAFASLASENSRHGDDDAAQGEAQAEIVFHPIPVWRAKNQTLVGHVVSAGHPKDTKAIPEDSLDLAGLSRAQADVDAAVQANGPHLVLVTLHWNTLDRLKTRSRYLERASQLSEQGRRYLVIAIRDVPEDLMSARIEERLREIRRFCRSISCLVDLKRRDFEQLRGLEFLAIGAEIAPNEMSEQEIIASMNGFLDAQAPLGTKSFVDGLRSKSLVIAALTAGFDYLSGSAIVDASGAAPGTRAFSIADLYGA